MSNHIHVVQASFGDMPHRPSGQQVSKQYLGLGIRLASGSRNLNK